MQGLAVVCRSQSQVKCSNSQRLIAVGSSHIKNSSRNGSTTVILQSAELIGLAPVSTPIVVIDQTADFFSVILVGAVLNQLAIAGQSGVVTCFNVSSLNLNEFFVLSCSSNGNCAEDTNGQCNQQKCNDQLRESFHYVILLKHPKGNTLQYIVYHIKITYK